MGFADLRIKETYDSEEDDVVNDFYIPVLSHSKKYWRLTGFFSSTSLSVAARGIKGLIKNNGEIKLVCSAMLKKEDVDAIKEGIERPEKVVEQMCIRELENIDNEFTKNHISALAWLIAKGLLEIKIVIPLDDDGNPLDKDTVNLQGIFHQKVGIFVDPDDKMISFSGSVNETYAGWRENIEEFKVFRSWEPSEAAHFQADLKKFEKFWFGLSNCTKTIPISEAIKNAIIKYVTSDIERLELEPPKYISGLQRKKIQLRDYQKEAIQNWIKNGFTGFFEMATGTGKTYVALGCAEEIMKTNKRIAIVIACPYNHLVSQWENEVNKFGIPGKKVRAEGDYSRWKDTLMDSIYDLNHGIIKSLIVLTTHATAMSDHFIDQIYELNCDILFIADEAHWLGAPQLRKALLPKYKFRVGLSATPKRWLDEDGTRIIEQFFGQTVFEFSIKKAIDEGFLVPYKYYPVFVTLTDEELDEYIEKTKRIARLYHAAKEDDKKAEIFERLLIMRQEIIKNAIRKIEEFKKLIESFETVSHTLVYCNDSKQMNVVHDVLSKIGIVYHEFTGEESKEKRQEILANFLHENYKIITAMKCLDEGVDVPPAKVAIILASTGNPRQYIQRRGRILRKSEGKDMATIYDFLVIPHISTDDDNDLYEIERKILRKELKRYKEFASVARNNLEAINRILPIMKEYGVYGGEE